MDAYLPTNPGDDGRDLLVNGKRILLVVHDRAKVVVADSIHLFGRSLVELADPI